ncbi:EAL domain-containing protein [Aeromonas encheleia]|uniref:EAL domain-containing protein n=1 Tax=Aeromonas encheleia TaxID=73010 RepID=UPI000FA067AF|nr:cyclic diguanylate phosphodiesterase [Aeromonas encheleia]UNP90484.1 EAL domain-containing protein [Aeromonas encheleia]
MPLYRTTLRHRYARQWGALLAGLLPIVLGLPIISWQTASEMRKDAEGRLLHAQHMFDRTLDHARQATSAVIGTVGKPCLEAVQGLRAQVATVPDVRSVSLAKGETIYCTSLHGPIQAHTELDDYTDGRLDLMKGNEVTPDRPLIVYRQVSGSYSALAGVDGYYLLNILDMLRRNTPLGLVVGQQMLLPDGRLTEQLFSPGTEGYLEQASEKYPYRVVTMLPIEVYGAHLWAYSKVSLILFPLLGLLFGFWVFRLMGRSASPTQELRRALDQREFIPYIQPVVTGDDTGNLYWSGCEVLMRWQHPLQGLIPPDRFIPLAEDSGLIIPMTSEMMTQVRDHFAPHAHRLPKGFHFGVNISASQCKDLSLVEICRDFIDAFRDNPIQLVLELTERELLVANEVTDRLFAELRVLGVLIAIDDFGTGHSTLTYLQKFHVDFLKIDKSFVGMIGSDALSSHIVENVIDLASRLGLKLVAEGIETELQSDYLRARQVTFLQGYFYGRPMPMSEFTRQMSL